MCGIVGMFALDGKLDPVLSRWIGLMTDSLAHRGPDGDGFFVDGRIALGHRRLAIIDREGGAQPQWNEDDTVCVVFNGEIYNHHGIRARLAGLGHRFRTTSDTETIVHAYEQFGTGCVDYLEGMFAFAVYDQREGSVFLARDRLGKKPLFYAILGGVLHFASEMKALMRSGAWDGTLALETLEGYLSLGYFVAPHTPYRHVRKMLPAQWLFASGGRVQLRSYWDIAEFDSEDTTEDETLAQLDDVLRGAVRARLESEVPLGAFLSGGIDSGLVVSYMRESEASPLVTVSVGFDDAAHNELRAAEITARHCGSLHYPHIIRPTLEDVLEPLTTAFDEPFADSSAVPTLYLCRMAREHVTVALSGDGGDETFAGYEQRYVPERIEGYVRPFLSAPILRTGTGALARGWPQLRGLPRALRLASVLENLRCEPEEAYYADLCFMRPAACRALLGRAPLGDARLSPVFEDIVGPFRRCSSPSLLQRVQYADLKVYLPNDPLVKVDRLSMWAGLEVRCPLLDRSVVEYAFKLPTHRKMPGVRTKRLLRALAGTRLPAALSKLPKHGFTAPVSRWLAGPFAGVFHDEVIGSDSFVNGVCDAHRVANLFEEHRTGRADHGYVLWALWMLERWHNKYEEAAARVGEAGHDAVLNARSETARMQRA